MTEECALCHEPMGDNPLDRQPMADDPVHWLCVGRKAEGRCLRCGNWPTICGHGLTFKQKMQSIQVDYSSLRS